jgi:FAD-dependent oxidoreductase family protein
VFWDRRNFVKRLGSALAVLKGIKVGKEGEASSSPTEKGNSPQPPLVPRIAQSRSTTAGDSYVRPGTIEVIHKQFDLIVVGGGISGTCAAISAARNGSRAALVHERSVLGGNSSSEVRLFPEDTCGFSTWVKESGILEEIHTEERVRNWEPYIEGLMNSHWDLVLYEWAIREKNLTLFAEHHDAGS